MSENEEKCAITPCGGARVKKEGRWPFFSGRAVLISHGFDPDVEMVFCPVHARRWLYSPDRMKARGVDAEFKSAGITLALVLYALILGLPVTLLLTVVVKMDPSNALARGAAVALWTVSAGPGVEGPGRQMRRTLSSLVPSRKAAMVMAGVLAAGAALSLILAYGTYGDDAREAVWSPVDVGSATDLLEKLHGGDDG